MTCSQADFCYPDFCIEYSFKSWSRRGDAGGLMSSAHSNGMQVDAIAYCLRTLTSRLLCRCAVLLFCGETVSL